MGDKIEHMQCAVCKKNITKLQKGDIIHDVHFDISRSIKTFNFNPDEGTFEEELRERNLKMERNLCRDCFETILNESKTLGNLFAVTKDGKKYFVY